MVADTIVETVSTQDSNGGGGSVDRDLLVPQMSSILKKRWCCKKQRLGIDRSGVDGAKVNGTEQVVGMQTQYRR